MEYNKSYAREMRAARRLAQWADSHQNIVNASLIIEAIAFTCYIYMFA